MAVEETTVTEVTGMSTVRAADEVLAVAGLS